MKQMPAAAAELVVGGFRPEPKIEKRGTEKKLDAKFVEFITKTAAVLKFEQAALALQYSFVKTLENNFLHEAHSKHGNLI